MIRNATESDYSAILEVINDAAMAYKGIIPADRWHEPYMTRAELEAQIEEGVQFICSLEDEKLVGVMGIQDRGEVSLIRHAYVATQLRGKGIGTQLLRELINSSQKPILIGTWKAASWAIRFYEKHGFSMVSEGDKNVLLKKFWSIPDRQVETSVVLADSRYREQVRV